VLRERFAAAQGADNYIGEDMKYFLTGATGFIGGVLAHQLQGAGHEVHAVVRQPGKAVNLKNIGVQLFPGDVTDKESMRPAMQGVDGVFHVAGWYKVGTRDKSAGERVNIQGTRNVLELMRDLRIPRGVYTSTLAVNSDTKGRLVDERYRFTGRHLSEYDRTKAIAHDIADRFIGEGLPLNIVMPGMTYGPGDTSSLRANFIAFLRGQLPMLPSRTAMCWAHVEDIAQGHLRAMETTASGQTFIIAGESSTLVKLFHLASQITGKRAPLTMPYLLFRCLSLIVKPFDKFLPEAYTSEGLRVIAGVTYLGDNSKAKRELGYNPRPLRVGLEETLRHEMQAMNG
jgi:nucleoside-diphosphate-sugar epimerase